MNFLSGDFILLNQFSPGKQREEVGMMGERVTNIINLRPRFESTIYWLYDLGINLVTPQCLIVPMQQIVTQVSNIMDCFVIACFGIGRV